MPDSDYHPDEESEERARTLASRTIEDLRKSREQPRGPEASPVTLESNARELGIDVPVRDVSYVLEEFAWQWELAQEFGGKIPCVRIVSGEQEEIVPLSLPFEWPFPGPFKSWRWMRRYYPFPPDFFYEAYQDFLRSRGESDAISIESSDDALERLQNSLGDFLAYRIAGFRAWVSWMMGGEGGSSGGKKPLGGGGRGGRSGFGGSPPLPPSSSPGGGLGVEVSCTTPGLTLEFSHAYFIHFLHFGAPTTPVKNMLSAGRYVFQGKGPMYPTGTQRSPIFRIPPDYKPLITYF